MVYCGYTLASPGGACNTARALATPPRERNTGAMSIFHPTPKYISETNCLEVFCWTCQRPILRPAHYVRRKIQSGGMYYCSPTCYQDRWNWWMIARIWSSIRLEGECWIWQGTLNHAGYGYFTFKQRGYLAHRYIYALARGPIPPMLDLDHLCRRPACVNPAHLEAVSHQVNMFRIRAPHCGKGHLYTLENTYIYKNGKRACRQCNRENQARMYQRRARSTL